ncbi:uncharacterized protein CXorf49-like isoform X2 [Peromyscus leucopus]|uniref:uncharacterized protein CXorf49-like isoform X2 n=1 Tax=Peromyscus leucopus TaxID=10041 RepID=UPI001885208B|nr:uncharacterized protein CXorf49-like isoform X2 [Peromyscus leucopus]
MGWASQASSLFPHRPLSPPQRVLSEEFLCELPTHRAEQPCMCLHHGEMSSGDPNTRAPQVPANSQLMALSQRGISPRTLAPAGDQGPSVVPPLPLGEKHHQAPGTLGCQQP